MNYLSVLKQSFKGWQEDQIPTWSAALSYYTIFAISPLLLLLISIVSIVIDPRTLKVDLFLQIQASLGREAAVLITDSLKSAKENGGVGASIIGFFLLLLGASGVFGQLKATLNHIFKVKHTPENAVTDFIEQKMVGFLMILAIGVLLFFSVGASTFLSAMGNFVSTALPIPQFTLELGNFVLSFLVISVLFALIYKVLPDIKLPRQILWEGSLISALLFTLGKTALGLYLGNGAVGSGFGAAASLAVILVWIYYSSLIFFFGAEIIKTYANNEGIILILKKHAISTVPERDKEKTFGLIERILSYIFSGLVLRLMRKIAKR